MVPIHTHPPSKEYDEGWDRIFGTKSPEQNPPETRPENQPDQVQRQPEAPSAE